MTNDHALQIAQRRFDAENPFDGPDESPRCGCGGEILRHLGKEWCADCRREHGEFTQSMKTGAQQIAEERQRQMDVEGWTPEHDDTHAEGQLIEASICYAATAGAVKEGVPENRGVLLDSFERAGIPWPFFETDFKPSDDPIRNLVKAGALIAAEIDRLQRATATPADEGARG